jgi:hypothetical protein
MPTASRDRTVRLQVHMSEEEAEAIDEYRFRFRPPTRSAAVRALLQKGMALADKAKDNGAK